MNTSYTNLLQKAPLLLFLTVFLIPFNTTAHVKWFSSFDFLEKSKSTQEITDLNYWALTLLSLVVISLFLFIEKKILESSWNQKVDNWLDKRKRYGHYVITIATFTVLFVAWVNGTVLTPELTAKTSFLPWFQFFLALLVLIPSTTALAGMLLIALYLYCVIDYGFFYMLDYLHFVGIGLYLSTIRSKKPFLQQKAIPALYITLGFSLIWLAFEKLYYPSWAIQLLEQHPQLALGLPHDFFVKAAAFVEIALGFMMLMGTAQRLLAGTITIVFILTSLFFGKVEIIGHTSLHAMLILFILTGTEGVYSSIIHKKWATAKKIIVSSLAYMGITLLVLFAYKVVSDQQYLWAKEKATQNGSKHEHSMRMVDVSMDEKIPEITLLEVLEEPMQMGYNLHVELKNWTFTPEQVGKIYQANQGHIHVYVDGKKAGRMYSNWFYLGKLPKGTHKVAITLNGDDHTAITIGNKMIGAERKVSVD